MEENVTKEPQYKICLDLRDGPGFERFGLMSNEAWQNDPKRLLFLLSRYKFVSKMLCGKQNVLEVGCADAFGTRLVAQEVKNVTAVDFDPVFIEDARANMNPKWKYELAVHDILSGPVPGEFDAAYSLDVIEHIKKEDETAYVENICASLASDGVLIVGSPSENSQVYASAASKEGHVNCKSAPDLKGLLQRYFDNVFIFSMNDEVVHTGFHPMAHYLFAVCSGRK